MFFDFLSIDKIRDALKTSSESGVSTTGDISAEELLSKKTRDLLINQFNMAVSYNTLPHVDIAKEGVEGAAFKLLKKNTTNQVQQKRYILGQVVRVINFPEGYRGINVGYLVSIPSEASYGPSYEIFETLDTLEGISKNFGSISHNIFFPLTVDICNRLRASEGDYVILERQSDSMLVNSISGLTLNIYHGLFSEGELDAEPSVDEKQAQYTFKSVNDKYKLNLQSVQQSVNVSLSEQTNDLVSVFSGKLSLPSSTNKVSSMMGLRPNPVKDGIVSDDVQFHKGLDFPLEIGSDVNSVLDGEVIFAGNKTGTANTILIKHTLEGKTIISLYGHLSQYLIKVGDKVSTGKLIAKSGNIGRSTGPHLHFELRDELGKQLNPIFILNGSIEVPENLKERYALSSTSLKLPLPNSSILLPNSQDNIASSTAPAIVASIPESNPNNLIGDPRSIPATSPKLLLVDLPTDFSVYSTGDYSRGSKLIKVREDLYNDLVKIKEILNYFAIPFSTQYIDVSIKNKDLSYLARLGLEFNFNYNSTLTPQTNIKYSDYLVCPNLGKSVFNNGYELELWGRVRSTADRQTISGYTPEKRELKVYDISTSYKDSKSPNIVEINGIFLNITKILKDHGFYHASPKFDFFKYSDYKSSNWWVIQSNSRLNIGDAYEQALSKVYLRDKNLAWVGSDNKVWNGKMFVDKKVTNE